MCCHHNGIENIWSFRCPLTRGGPGVSEVEAVPKRQCADCQSVLSSEPVFDLRSRVGLRPGHQRRVSELEAIARLKAGVACPWQRRQWAEGRIVIQGLWRLCTVGHLALFGRPIR